MNSLSSRQRGKKLLSLHNVEISRSPRSDSWWKLAELGAIYVAENKPQFVILTPAQPINSLFIAAKGEESPLPLQSRDVSLPSNDGWWESAELGEIDTAENKPQFVILTPAQPMNLL